MEEAKKKNNIILDFITSFIYIPVYSLLGIKFILSPIYIIVKKNKNILQMPIQNMI